ncbi:hypothetical protein CEXT_92121 [Caerostris extrusa]|uniref:Uncharacterized protein n=1 Tax=Caerostris extrusa TaxID=172846 RepID=A0AAV4WJX7_CAEEX|nr:hypothetical protein CEXT_92121 [Caerostris extrusa]
MRPTSNYISGWTLYISESLSETMPITACDEILQSCCAKRCTFDDNSDPPFVYSISVCEGTEVNESIDFGHQVCLSVGLEVAYLIGTYNCAAVYTGVMIPQVHLGTRNMITMN